MARPVPRRLYRQAWVKKTPDGLHRNPNQLPGQQLNTKKSGDQPEFGKNRTPVNE